MSDRNNSYWFHTSAVFWTGESDSWVEAYHPDFVQPVSIKFRIRAGQVTIVALRLDNDEEITTTALRAIKLPPLTAALHWHLQNELSEADYDVDQARERMLSSARELGDGDGRPTTDREWEQELNEELNEALDFRERLRGWLEQVEVSHDEVEGLQRRGRGAKPPTMAEYLIFAKVYEQELQAGERGAKTRTAKRLHVDRGTVYKWIKACRSFEPPLLDPNGA